MRGRVINIRIAQIADIHQSLGYPGPSPLSRFDDINRILDWTADRIIEEKVQLCLIAGDCFKDAKVMLDRASQEIASIVRFLRKLSGAGIEVIVISGTPSHDAIAAYELIKEMQIDDVLIYTQPKVLLSVGDHPTISCLPGLNRSMLMTQEEYKGLPPEQVHRIMTDKITQLCQGMAAQMPNDKPKILMAHLTYQGADTGFTDLLMQNEPILTREACSGFDLVCLGHIHIPQIIDGKVCYPGPIERLSFNDEKITPGFWIHKLGEPGERFVGPGTATLNFIDVDKKIEIPAKSMSFVDCDSNTRRWNHEFIETPARSYKTMNWDENMVEQFIKGKTPEPLTGQIVRLHYSCSEEIAKQLNRKQLEQSLYQAGCFYCSEIKADISRVDRARDATVNESLTIPQALAKWCGNQGIDDAETQALVGMTEELLCL